MELLVPGLEPPPWLSGVVTTTPATLFSDLFLANCAAPAAVSRAERFSGCADPRQPGLQFRLQASGLPSFSIRSFRTHQVAAAAGAFFKSQPLCPALVSAWSSLARVMERSAVEDCWLANLIHCVLFHQPLSRFVTNQDSIADGEKEIRKPRGLEGILREFMHNNVLT